MHLGGNVRRGVAELDSKVEVVGGIVIMGYGENALNVISGVDTRTWSEVANMNRQRRTRYSVSMALLDTTIRVIRPASLLNVAP